MSKLITQSSINLEINKQEALISHIEIANQTGVDEQNTKDLIEKYKIQLEQVGGKVGFQTLASGKTKQTKTIYLLNEQQSTLLVLMMRNTPIVLKFKVKLVQAFFEAKTQIHDRNIAKLEYPQMTVAIQEAHENPKPYHYSNEADLINRIILGTTAKKYCELNEIDRTCLRDNLTNPQIDLINHLQRLNTSMIEIGMSFEDRKEKLQIRYAQLIQKLLS